MMMSPKRLFDRTCPVSGFSKRLSTPAPSLPCLLNVNALRRLTLNDTRCLIDKAGVPVTELYQAMHLRRRYFAIGTGHYSEKSNTSAR
jgi:hypothetical protein